MKIFSVTEITQEIRLLLEGRFSEIWIEGEISNFRVASSGHFYFSLKDSRSQIRMVMFRGANLQLRFKPENGLSVLCYGNLSLYEPRGEYQIVVEHMEPKGIGALQLAFEQLKKKLEAEGLFSPQRKRPIPFLPRKIGMVTSRTGAVIRDMIHVLTRRFPNIQILLYPVLVQGDGAAQKIAEGIETLNDLNQRELLGIDVLIVGRGGGSVEDLWAFNEEVVARAIEASAIPVISAVGHETDFTIADFVADLRAPTPSAAAELAVPVREELFHTLEKQRHCLYQAVEQKIENERLLLKQWEGYFQDPGRRLTEVALHLDHLREKIISLSWHQMETDREGVRRWKQHLEALSPLAILERGYSLVMPHGKKKLLKKSSEVQPDDIVDIQLSTGRLESRVIKSV